MVSTVNETKTHSELVEWLRVWANGYEDGDALDDNDARQIADAVERVCAPCNAAAMRETMHQLSENLLNRIAGVCPNLTDEGMLLLAEKALAAPARNCDRFKTLDEAREAYWAYREPLELNDKPFVAITEWLFAPAEGGKE